ncbi:E2 ubiquitin-conjugating enzyme [Purpureocillium takamizusanense]|uniref:E2 ubiquitin-conjugating enzyme n=1 Tax=Purpureocillium takamizusanense TaxID=2060973 RepID=A0A9Q8Q8S4_9HYPO|nr:E2 ubiquitin-conjugating enzyme [Purpureocillium takamizusanense]UNI14482.1 E2 ubiquitin-conjugating enzyme [Purpureocillium takamizusanense]
MSSRGKSSAGAADSAKTATKRLIKELDVWRKEQREEQGIERLGPVSEDNLLEWEAVINGRGIGCGYDAGRWLLSISVPAAYPLQPPKMRFATPVVHPNIALATGEICLDLLKDAWTPAYSVLECVRAVRMLLGCPETDSPLNVDVAALLRQGDILGTRKLVECWCADDGGRYDGP